MISLAFKNFKNSFVRNKSIYTLLIVSQLVGVMIIFFVYGIYTGYNASLQEIDVDSKMLYAEFDSSKDSTLDELRAIMDKLYKPFEKYVDYTFLGLADSKGMLCTYYEYRDGEYHIASSLLKNQNSDEDGRYFDNSEYVRGDKVLFGSDKEVGEYLDINGEQFLVVGNRADEHLSHVIEVPVTAAPGDTYLYVLVINFERLPRQAEYEHFKNTLEETFGNRVIVRAFDVKDMEQLISINSIIIISVIIGVLVALDTVLIYSYIIGKRRKDMAIFGIVGAKRGHRFLINQIEIMSLSVMVAIFGYAIFRFGFQDFVVEFCDISVELYSDKVYGIMMIGYMVSVFIISYIATFVNTRKNILKMLRGYKDA